MARKSNAAGLTADAVIGAFMKLPTKVKAALVGVVVVVGLVAWVAGKFHHRTTDTPPVPPGGLVFMWWNVENLFDDKADRRRQPDKDYDDWFVNDPADRELKYQHLCDIILKQNDGKGPDILGCCEVESVQAGEMLRDALNARLTAGVPKYESFAMKEIDSGRHIAPCVISRVPINAGRTRQLGSRIRVLEVHLTANGHDLMLVASHWTSQLTQRDGGNGEEGRDKYADTIHRAYADAVRADPKLDFLVCGDFNDAPDAEAVVSRLHMTGDRTQVMIGADPPRLFGLLAGKPPAEYGTLFYGGKKLIYDQIGVSPGMLDSVGWACDPDSLRVPTDSGVTGNKGVTPFRFGNANDKRYARGYSDHFPIVLTLRVAP